MVTKKKSDCSPHTHTQRKTTEHCWPFVKVSEKVLVKTGKCKSHVSNESANEKNDKLLIKYDGRRATKRGNRIGVSSRTQKMTHLSLPIKAGGKQTLRFQTKPGATPSSCLADVLTINAFIRPHKHSNTKLAQ